MYTLNLSFSFKHAVNIDKMAHLIDMIKEVIPVWDNFCLQLGIAQIEIESMAGEVVGSTKYLTKMFEIWINRNDNEATIDKLIVAAGKQNTTIAEIICSKKEMKGRFPGN